MHTRTLTAAAMAVVLGCTQQPSAQMQAQMDSLSAAATERDRLMQEMADNARLVSDISVELAKVRVPRTAFKTSSETPMRASRDSMLQRARYIATRLNQAESRLAENRQRIATLTHLSDSLRASLDSTLANYQSIVETQRATIEELTGQVTTLSTEKMALQDTVANMSTRENTVYYIVGTKSELIEQGIITEEGGGRILFIFGRTGRTLAPARQLDPRAFTAINKREVTEIPLPDPAALYRVASRQNLTYLDTPADEKGRITGTAALRITAPEQFWSQSKYLIIVQQG